MEYYTADTYKNWQRIGEPFYNNNGKLSIKVKTVCPRCSGSGVYAIGVENGQIKLHPAYNGVCLQCNSLGYIEKEIRLYTKAEYDTMQRNNERARQRKAEAAEAKRLAEFNTKKAKWLSDNGFDAEGNTYLYIGQDSYSIKDDLKAAGYRYNPILRWHAPVPAGYEKTELHNVDEFYELTAWGTYTPYPDAKSKVESIIEASRPASTSEWFGEIGKRFKEVPVTLVGVHGFQGQYGYSQVVKFQTETGDALTWFTSVNIPIEVGESCFLTGIVKKWTEYKGEKTTIITRAKIS